ncbi:hypothetical protein BIV57_06850 [Mangrovactinospora gilvigrisea]|uniref:Phosphodiesterase n=1 Tax=Mangrovactinospora gilvigrisea TaxID=1428644 RepID=A0A1J7BHT6_9ACTN|nr:alkaline phosphatase family protein [Mangrovactinospora gilvigrisea]OIV38247.1 hypothetical protein BIV57_06850 [Mangrovactinospora gilvigrisea]
MPLGPAGNRTRKTLVVGIDGTLFDRVRDADAPTLAGLAADGLLSEWLLPYDSTGGSANTESGPGWSNIATGVWPDKHGVLHNGFDGKRFDKYPDFLTRLKAADPEASTFAVANWSPILTERENGPIFSPAVDVRVDGGRACDAGEDALCTALAARYLREQNPDAAFVYIGQVDEISHGLGPDSDECLTAIGNADAHLRELLDALRARPTYPQEEWLVLVTTDHGHKPGGGHGGPTLPERSAWVVAHGPGIPAGAVRDDVRHVDILPTVLDWAGVAVDPAWDLDGRPLREFAGV